MNPDWWARNLLLWHGKHGRAHLPWKTTNPELIGYYTLVSELMLQQTQAQRVCAYFPQFIRTFPTVADLAQAELSQVLTCWSGLGYYRRAHYLHQSAQLLWQRQQQGLSFPCDAATLTQLPGIGTSTAHAILAQAYGHAVPILDANVKRILSRLYALESPTQDALWTLSKNLTSTPQARTRAADFCQAMMDFGSLVCTKKPQCSSCFAQPHCQAQNHKHLLNQRLASAPKVQRLPLCVALVMHQNKLWLKPQAAHELWPSTLMPLHSPSFTMLTPMLDHLFGKQNLHYLGRTRIQVKLSHRHFRVQALAYHLKAPPAAPHPSNHWHPFRLTQLPLSSVALRIAQWAKGLTIRPSIS